MFRSWSAGVSALGLVLAACGAGGDKASDSAGGEGSPSVQASTGGGTATTIHLVVAGGPHGGTYDAKSSDITCSYGLAGEGVWGNQYSVTGKKPNEFSSLQLIAPQAAGGTDKFLLTVGFGELMEPEQGYTEHTINTGVSLTGKPDDSKREGSGTITVEDKGKAGKVTFKGKTKDNVALEGTLDCHQMMRSGD